MKIAEEKCWNYINSIKSKKDTAMLIFDVGLVAENFEGTYLEKQRSENPQKFVLLASHKS